MRTAIAQADVTVAPSAEGYFGAWLAAELPPGVPGERVLVRAPNGSAPSAYVPGWRAVGSGDWALDVARWLHLGERTGARAVLAGIVESTRPVDGYLLVGTEGKVAVFLDGSAIYRRGYATHSLSWEVVPIALTAGQHQLVIELQRKSDRWNFGARLLDRADLMPPDGAVLRLPGLDEAAGARLLDATVKVEVRLRTTPDGFEPRLAVRVPRGAPVASQRRVVVSLDPNTPARRTFALGALPVTARGVFDLEASLPSFPAPGTVEMHAMEVAMGTLRQSVKFRLDPTLPELLKRALDAQRRIRAAAPGRSDVVFSTLEARIRALSDLDPTDPTLSDHVRSLEAVLAILERGGDPFRERPGVTEWVHVSRLDGSLHSFLLHVPESYRTHAASSYPLVIVLHGYRGTPDGVLKAFIDRDAHDSRAAVDGFVLAPEAFGDAFYRGPGEAEVMDLIDWVQATFPIDARRISMTGVSMGGTGTAQIAFRYADRFSAAGPLAGYHSYFIRRDTAGKPLRPWEKPLMHHFSPVSWAENGRHLFLFVAHGTEDTPTENSRVLTRRYTELGYDLVAEWPPTGHAVWKVAYSGARLWPVLTARRSPDVPAKVTLVTDRLRYGREYWLTVDEIESPDAMARIEAEVVGPRRVTISTRNVLGFSIVRASPRVEATGPVTIAVDGRDLELADAGPLHVTRSQDGWHPSAGAGDVRKKRAGVEGPIDDAFSEPLIFVYGTLDPKATRANREVAEYFATVYTGSARYPVRADVAFDDRLAETHSLVLVGAAGSNAVLSSLESRLPIRADTEGIVFGTERYRSDEAGAMFIYPHPDHPNRYVVAVVAADCRGIWRARSLPRLLPDFVVYDERTAPAAGEQVLGEATLRAAGFFNRDWTLPASL